MIIHRFIILQFAMSKILIIIIVLLAVISLFVPIERIYITKHINPNTLVYTNCNNIYLGEVLLKLFYSSDKNNGCDYINNKIHDFTTLLACKRMKGNLDQQLLLNMASMYYAISYAIELNIIDSNRPLLRKEFDHIAHVCNELKKQTCGY